MAFSNSKEYEEEAREIEESNEDVENMIEEANEAEKSETIIAEEEVFPEATEKEQKGLFKL